MTLEELIGETEELTESLRAAVAAGDEPACGPLLQRRQQVLAGLEKALGDADQAERTALAQRLGRLTEADRALRTAAETALAQVGDAVRLGFGLHGRSVGNQDRAPHSISLDRRA
jgi:hypothetical protein